MTRAVVKTSKIERSIQLAGAGLTGVRLRRASSEQAKRSAQAHLVQRLGRLRGLPQKVGQMLSMNSDEETASAFAQLTDSAEPVALDELIPVIEETWGRDPYEVCESIDPAGRAASIGQVHQAVLRDGRSVAIKVQYPGIREAIRTDLGLLGWLSEPMGGLRRGFNLQAYREVICDSLDEELDYRIEAQHQRAYAKATHDLAVIVPEVIDDLSGELVLTTVWEDGQTLEQAKTWDKRSRAALARQIMKHFQVMLFDRGLIHGDPHSGNYRFRGGPGDPQIVLYDYGCVREIPAGERLALLRLINDTHNAPSADPFPLFVKLGFDPDTLQPLRHKLPALCRVLLEPFGAPMKFDLDSWDRANKISDILEDDRLNFRISGPARLIFLMRAFHGLIYYLNELGESVSWSQFMKPMLGKYADDMQRLDLTVPADPTTSFATLAKHLCIRVTDQGVVKAKVTLPAAAIDDLETVISPDVLERIRDRGLCLRQIVKNVRAGRYAPQRVIDIHDNGKRCEVWLQ